MPSAAALRLEIEAALENRIPGALTPRPRVFRDLAPTAVPELDALLDGGLPIGAISEFVGPLCSGRTSLAFATLAEMTQAAKTVAWVDTSDALDPESAAAAGIVLSRQLWVRCGQSASISASYASHASGPQAGAPLLVEGSRTPAPGGGCGSPHPRGEARGMSQAIDAFLQPGNFARTLPPRHHYNQGRKDRMVGTPGAPNRKLLHQASLDRTPQDPRPFPRRAKDREEQIPTDRQPSRRQAWNTQLAKPQAAKSLQSAQIANTAEAAQSRPQGGHWTDNSNNAHGRAFHTPPNAIAAGLPRFREMEARAQGQGHGLPQGPFSWKPPVADLRGNTTQLPATQARQAPTPRSAESHSSPGKTAPLVSLPSGAPQANPKAKPGRSLAGERPANLSKTASPLWQALDQALRATDLLLAAGGFSAIVLDLGSIPPEFAWRIPLATWFRFRAAADRARTVLLVLTQHPCARSSAELVLRFTPVEPRSQTTVLTGARFRVHLDRRRFETQPSPATSTPAPAAAPTRLHLVPTRKQPQREVTWDRAAAWSSTGTEPPTTQGGHTR